MLIQSQSDKIFHTTTFINKIKLILNYVSTLIVKLYAFFLK